MGFFAALTLALIILKLCNFIALSWWIVLFGPLLVWGVCVGLLLGVLALLKLF